MTFDIRLAHPSEYDAVGELTVEAYSHDGFVRGEYAMTLRAAADRAAKAELWVAADSSGLLGTVTYCPVGSVYREIGQDDEGEFRMLGVAGRARGLGVGTVLTERCIARSREAGMRRVVMCSAQYMTTAHRLYERLGFTRLPERDWAPIPGVDLYAFALDL
ncbi:ribosomal protein S18 acetylase RimI-like enzyme [Kribbella aluminosa]|uniref:Ribosomal protein S18 acetylase RimI-like enzyme n=1 Tax=Kribbella aluminosa TaxID=416017 RepID=A0ABS4UHN4_9ACTN|nr:GNAT family N-acetyltransferase [Kribbella aluminosa]MBP2351158.1 ribosomal protein S18 acetylase RimI-like enzyme [Kribbella aluminosa]